MRCCNSGKEYNIGAQKYPAEYPCRIEFTDKLKHNGPPSRHDWVQVNPGTVTTGLLGAVCSDSFHFEEALVH